MRDWLCRLASLYLTLAALLAFAGLLLWSRLEDVPVGGEIALPLGVLMLNLLAAVATKPKLYRQAGLLVFHLGLAGLAAIGGVGQLIAFKGRLEVAEGTRFSVQEIEGARPFLRDLPELETPVVQGPFAIDYDPGMRRRHTRSQVAVSDGRGVWRETVVGDDKPLLLEGYRFYTTANKGFAPVLTWTDRQGRSAAGALHLPSYPLNYDRQGLEWRPPGTPKKLLVWLEMPEQLFDEAGSWQFRRPDPARLALVDGDRREVLEPGQEMELAEGTLRYERLGVWMGYTVFYDPTMPWLVAAAMATILGLAWHVIGRLRAPSGGESWRKADHVD